MNLSDIKMNPDEIARAEHKDELDEKKRQQQAGLPNEHVCGCTGK